MFRSKIPIVPHPGENREFQSLFSWMFRSKSRRSQYRYCRSRFNPCSRGCFARRIYTRREIERYNPVSILVLVDVSLEVEYIATIKEIYLFKSLFSWMFRSKRGIVGESRTGRCVSILVLVDVSLEEILPSYRPLKHRRFQSLFSWMFR